MPALIFSLLVVLTWVPPTENIDGTPYEDPEGIKVYIAAESGGPYILLTDLQDPTANRYEYDEQAPGLHYYVVTAYNASQVESDFSNEGQKFIGGPQPQSQPEPPEGLFVQEVTVFTLVKQSNRFVLISVGTVPPGTQCDPEQNVNGYYAVPVSEVAWAGSVRPVIVVAKCY